VERWSGGQGTKERGKSEEDCNVKHLKSELKTRLSEIGNSTSFGRWPGKSTSSHLLPFNQFWMTSLKIAYIEEILISKWLAHMGQSVRIHRFLCIPSFSLIIKNIYHVDVLKRSVIWDVARLKRIAILFN
jgi:hypothetical protein